MKGFFELVQHDLEFFDILHVERRIVFPNSMTGSKPKALSTASEQKKTRAAEAEARKRKHPEASATAPSKNNRKTKKERAAPIRVQP